MMADLDWQDSVTPAVRWLVLFDLESTCSDDPGGTVIGRGEGDLMPTPKQI